MLDALGLHLLRRRMDVCDPVERFLHRHCEWPQPNPPNPCWTPLGWLC